MRIFSSNISTTIPFVAAAFGLLLILSGCSTSALPVGLTARMDQSGATLDRNEAMQLINQFRIARGARPVSQNAQLSALAQNLANQYSASSNRPAKPNADIIHLRLSAGYATFAETFSGWRGSSDDADAIADPRVTSAGLAVAYSANSAYGVHWVLLLSGAPATGSVNETQ